MNDTIKKSELEELMLHNRIYKSLVSDYQKFIGDKKGLEAMLKKEGYDVKTPLSSIVKDLIARNRSLEEELIHSQNNSKKLARMANQSARKSLSSKEKARADEAGYIFLSNRCRDGWWQQTIATPYKFSAVSPSEMLSLVQQDLGINRESICETKCNQSTGNWEFSYYGGSQTSCFNDS